MPGRGPPLLAAAAALLLMPALALALPFPAQPADPEHDSEDTQRVLGSSVVTSVSVVMDLGNGTRAVLSNPSSAKSDPMPVVGSPATMMNPDRYEFYTFDESGDLVRRYMTLPQIQSIIAGGDGTPGAAPGESGGPDSPPSSAPPGEPTAQGVRDVVASVQNVLKSELEASKNKPPVPGTPSPPSAPITETSAGDTTGSWSMLLPAIMGSPTTRPTPVATPANATDKNTVTPPTSLLPQFQETPARPTFRPGVGATPPKTPAPSTTTDSKESSSSSSEESGEAKPQAKPTEEDSSEDETSGEEATPPSTTTTTRRPRPTRRPTRRTTPRPRPTPTPLPISSETPMLLDVFEPSPEPPLEGGVLKIVGPTGPEAQDLTTARPEYPQTTLLPLLRPVPATDLQPPPPPLPDTETPTTAQEFTTPQSPHTEDDSEPKVTDGPQEKGEEQSDLKDISPTTQGPTPEDPPQVPPLKKVPTLFLGLLPPFPDVFDDSPNLTLPDEIPSLSGAEDLAPSPSTTEPEPPITTYRPPYSTLPPKQASISDTDDVPTTFAPTSAEDELPYAAATTRIPQTARPQPPQKPDEIAPGTLSDDVTTEPEPESETLAPKEEPSKLKIGVPAYSQGEEDPTPAKDSSLSDSSNVDVVRPTFAAPTEQPAATTEPPTVRPRPLPQRTTPDPATDELTISQELADSLTSVLSQVAAQPTTLLGDLPFSEPTTKMDPSDPAATTELPQEAKEEPEYEVEATTPEPQFTDPTEPPSPKDEQKQTTVPESASPETNPPTRQPGPSLKRRPTQRPAATKVTSAATEAPEPEAPTTPRGYPATATESEAATTLFEPQAAGPEEPAQPATTEGAEPAATDKTMHLADASADDDGFDKKADEIEKDIQKETEDDKENDALVKRQEELANKLNEDTTSAPETTLGQTTTEAPTAPPEITTKYRPTTPPVTTPKTTMPFKIIVQDSPIVYEDAETFYAYTAPQPSPTPAAPTTTSEEPEIREDETTAPPTRPPAVQPGSDKEGTDMVNNSHEEAEPTAQKEGNLSFKTPQIRPSTSPQAQSPTEPAATEQPAVPEATDEYNTRYEEAPLDAEQTPAPAEEPQPTAARPAQDETAPVTDRPVTLPVDLLPPLQETTAQDDRYETTTVAQPSPSELPEETSTASEAEIAETTPGDESDETPAATTITAPSSEAAPTAAATQPSSPALETSTPPSTPDSLLTKLGQTGSPADPEYQFVSKPGATGPLGVKDSPHDTRPVYKPFQDTTSAPPPQVELLPAPGENLGLEATTVGMGSDVRKFANLCNELAFRLWTAVTVRGVHAGRSVVMSPMGVTSILAMVFLGARGPTSGQMNDILKLDDMVTFNPHQVFRNVTESVVLGRHPGVATAAFVRQLYSDRNKGKLLDFYKERAQQFYDGHVEEVNFSVITDIVRRRTNLLVKRQTQGRVPEYLRGAQIRLHPPLAAFGANIFQTDCSAASTEGRDGEMYFTVLPATRQRRLVPVPAAVWRSGFLAGYEPHLDCTAVALGGADSLVSVVLLLPGQQGQAAPGDGVAQLERRLTEPAFRRGAWSRVLRSLLPRPGLELQLPRFSHRSLLNVTAALQRMGLRDLFSADKADLRGLNGVANDLHLSDIVQVNSFGTCADLAHGARRHADVYPAGSAAGRAGRGDLRDVPLALRPRQAREPQPMPETAPRLRFDRPFLYAVRHNPTGFLLHMGRFNPHLLH